jgi:hypothetical protein
MPSLTFVILSGAGLHSHVIPGHGGAVSPEPMNTDGAKSSQIRVHGFPLSRE